MGLTPGPKPGVAMLQNERDTNALLVGPSGSQKVPHSDYEVQLAETAARVLDRQLCGEDLLAGVVSALQERAALAATASLPNDEASSSAVEVPSTSGRLGPGRVTIDKVSARGQLQYSQKDLAGAPCFSMHMLPRMSPWHWNLAWTTPHSCCPRAAEGLNNFSSFRANACVYAGKWMYEALIQTAWQPGIQQIGWATIHCPFTAEEGVGDAPDSYAYGAQRMP